MVNVKLTAEQFKHIVYKVNGDNEKWTTPE